MILQLHSIYFVSKNDAWDSMNSTAWTRTILPPISHSCYSVDGMGMALSKWIGLPIINALAVISWIQYQSKVWPWIALDNGRSITLGIVASNKRFVPHRDSSLDETNWLQWVMKTIHGIDIGFFVLYTVLCHWESQSLTKGNHSPGNSCLFFYVK